MSKLSVQQLKEYLENVFSLEGALYRHEQLVDGYTTLRQNNIPPEPAKHLPIPPKKPTLKTVEAEGEHSKMTVPEFLILIALTGTGGVGGLIFIISLFFVLLGAGDDAGGFLIVGSVLAFCSISFICLLQRVQASKDDKIKARIDPINQRMQKNYELAMKAHQIAVRNAENKYMNKMTIYAQQKNAYIQETNKQLKKFNEVKGTLQTSLANLYSQNIVYEKYRNFVAIATIYEYVDSGRCTELEGANGAYNMYESELRSNMIICSLSQIISDLSQIKDGQYTLYEKLRRSEETIEQILGNIHDSQKLTAYYAETAAIAASADRITYGVIC